MINKLLDRLLNKLFDRLADKLDRSRMSNDEVHSTTHDNGILIIHDKDSRHDNEDITFI